MIRLCRLPCRRCGSVPRPLSFQNRRSQVVVERCGVKMAAEVKFRFRCRRRRQESARARYSDLQSGSCAIIMKLQCLLLLSLSALSPMLHLVSEPTRYHLWHWKRNRRSGVPRQSRAGSMRCGASMVYYCFSEFQRFNTLWLRQGECPLRACYVYCRYGTGRLSNPRVSQPSAFLQHQVSTRFLKAFDLSTLRFDLHS